MKPYKIPIRQAVEADYPALCALWEELDEHHRKARPDLFRTPEGEPRARDWFQAMVSGPDSAILVADASGALVGMAVVTVQRPPKRPVRLVRPHVEIENLVVASSFRRQGLARGLVASASDWALQRGLQELELTVHEFNDEARAFYEAAGFRTARRRMSLNVSDTLC